MNRSRGMILGLLLLTPVLLPLVWSDTGPVVSTAAAADVLPRDTVVPLAEVTKDFPDVTVESGTGPNETSVGNAVRSISVVFTSADGKKKITLSVDEYATAEDAAAAFTTAIDASVVAPGFSLAATPELGEQAFAGSSQVGTEQHFGLGAREGRLIISATHAGDIPVTPENTARLIGLSDLTLAAAKQALGL